MKLNGLEDHFKTDENGFIVDFKQTGYFGLNPFMFSLWRNKHEKLNLTLDQFNFLIKNSDLKQIDYDNWNSLMFALYFNKLQNLNLTLDQFEYMINNSDLNLIYNCENKLVIQEFKKIQSEINNKNILSKINNKEIIKKIKI